MSASLAPAAAAAPANDNAPPPIPTASGLVVPSSSLGAAERERESSSTTPAPTPTPQAAQAQSRSSLLSPSASASLNPSTLSHLPFSSSAERDSARARGSGASASASSSSSASASGSGSSTTSHSSRPGSSTRPSKMGNNVGAARTPLPLPSRSAFGFGSGSGPAVGSSTSSKSDAMSGSGSGAGPGAASHTNLYSFSNGGGIPSLAQSSTSSSARSRAFFPLPSTSTSHSTLSSNSPTSTSASRRRATDQAAAAQEERDELAPAAILHAMSAAASLRLPQQRANAAAAGATGAFGARGGPSLWAFLAQARRKLRRRLRRVPLRVRGSGAGRLVADCHDDEEEEDREEEDEEEEEELMLIMGNDAGDMDSVVSAIALAYLLTYLPDRASALLGDHLPPPPPHLPMNAGLAPLSSSGSSSSSSSPLSANFPSNAHAHAHSPGSSSSSGVGAGQGQGTSQIKRRAYIPLIQGFRSEARLRPENLLVLQTFLTQDPLPPSPSPNSSGATPAGQTGAANTASQQRQPQPSSMKSAEQIAARAQQQEQAGTSGVSNTASPRKVSFPTSPSTSSSSTSASGASSAPEAPPLKRNNTFTLTGSGSASASPFGATSSSAGRGAGAGTSARPAGQSVFRDDAAAPACLIWLDDVLRPLLAHEAKANAKASAAATQQQQGSALPAGMRRGSTITGANQNPSANAAVGSVASPTQEIDLDDSYADDHGRRGTITELMTPMPIDTGSDYVSLLPGHLRRRRHRRRADFEEQDEDADDDDAEAQQPDMDAAELRKRLDLLSRAEQLSPSNGISFGLVDHNRLAPVWSAAAPSSRPGSPPESNGAQCQSTWRNDRVVRLIVDHHADEGAHPLLQRSSAPSTPSESASTAEEAFAAPQSRPLQHQQEEQGQGETLLRVVQSPDIEPVGSCASLVALLFRDELRQEGVVVEQAQMSHPTGAAAFSAGAAAEYADTETGSSGAGVGGATDIGASAVNSPSANDMAAYARYLAAKHRRKIPRGVVDLLLCPIMIDTDNLKMIPRGKASLHDATAYSLLLPLTSFADPAARSHVWSALSLLLPRYLPAKLITPALFEDSFDTSELESPASPSKATLPLLPQSSRARSLSSGQRPTSPGVTTSSQEVMTSISTVPWRHASSVSRQQLPPERQGSIQTARNAAFADSSRKLMVPRPRPPRRTSTQSTTSSTSTGTNSTIDAGTLDLRTMREALPGGSDGSNSTAGAGRDAELAPVETTLLESEREIVDLRPTAEQAQILTDDRIVQLVRITNAHWKALLETKRSVVYTLTPMDLLHRDCKIVGVKSTRVDSTADDSIKVALASIPASLSALVYGVEKPAVGWQEERTRLWDAFWSTLLSFANENNLDFVLCLLSFRSAPTSKDPKGKHSRELVIAHRPRPSAEAQGGGAAPAIFRALCDGLETESYLQSGTAFANAATDALHLRLEKPWKGLHQLSTGRRDRADRVDENGLWLGATEHGQELYVQAYRQKNDKANRKIVLPCVLSLLQHAL